MQGKQNGVKITGTDSKGSISRGQAAGAAGSEAGSAEQDQQQD
jgi:hypothetical protein